MDDDEKEFVREELKRFNAEQLAFLDQYYSTPEWQANVDRWKAPFDLARFAEILPTFLMHARQFVQVAATVARTGGGNIPQQKRIVAVASEVNDDIQGMLMSLSWKEDPQAQTCCYAVEQFLYTFNVILARWGYASRWEDAPGGYMHLATRKFVDDQIAKALSQQYPVRIEEVTALEEAIRCFPSPELLPKTRTVEVAKPIAIGLTPSEDECGQFVYEQRLGGREWGSIHRAVNKHDGWPQYESDRGVSKLADRWAKFHGKPLLQKGKQGGAGRRTKPEEKTN